MLKNDGGVLPLAGHLHILVAGDSAGSIPRQSGGWTLSWQGTGTGNAEFPQAQSIWAGIRDAVARLGGSTELSLDGTYANRPDGAIVVFGEPPYAEMKGDRPSEQFGATLAFDAGSQLALLQRLRAAGIHTVPVFLSGRPLYISPELAVSDAFVAAWLPGSEGGGVADLLFRTPDDNVAHDFTGRLSFAWPASPDQVPHQGGPNNATLFPLGYGLSYGSAAIAE